MLYEGVEVDTTQKAKAYTMPSPVGGLNGRDSLANMPETDAYQMDNVMPGTATCTVREGCIEHQPPNGQPVASLEVFAGAYQRVLAFAGSDVIDVTAKEEPATIKNDMNGDEVVSSMFSTVADNAQFLIITTGTDMPLAYNGTTLTPLVFTGPELPFERINFVCPYMGRLFFGIKDKLGFLYLPPGQIQGELEFYDLGQLSQFGGVVHAIATYSDDAGDGPADYIVFITNRGECLMFRGLDPGDANSWDMVGRYRAAEPIGRKCVADYAGDLLILTTEGVLQFSQVRETADTRYERTSLSSKLGDTLSKLNIYRDVWGWSMTMFPVGGILLVNVPASTSRTGRYYHFVMNTTTHAWARFFSDEWDGICWAMSNKKLFFGRYDGSIRIVGGTYDNLKEISFDVKQAYNYFKTLKHKHFKWAQFLVRSEAPVSLSSRLSVDYVEVVPATDPNPIGSGAGGEWDMAYWDQDYWGYGPYTQRWIQAYANYGVAASHWLQGTLKGASLEWYSTEHVYEEAEGLL